MFKRMFKTYLIWLYFQSPFNKNSILLLERLLIVFRGTEFDDSDALYDLKVFKKYLHCYCEKTEKSGIYLCNSKNGCYIKDSLGLFH